MRRSGRLIPLGPDQTSASTPPFRQRLCRTLTQCLGGSGVAGFEHWSHATVVAEEIFAFVAEHEIRTAVRMRYPVSMLAVQPRLQGAHSEVPKDFAERLAALSTTILRKTDLLSRLRGGTTIHILLVGAPLEALAGIIQRIAAELEAHRLVVDGVE